MIYDYGALFVLRLHLYAVYAKIYRFWDRFEWEWTENADNKS